MVSAVLVVVANEGKPEFASIAVIPTLLFMALDAYYLALEKRFRGSYNAFLDKLHDGALAPTDLYAVARAHVWVRMADVLDPAGDGLHHCALRDRGQWV